MSHNQAEESLELARQLHPLLANRDPGVVGAALADVVSLWLAGHQLRPGSDADIELARDKIFKRWIKAVRNLVPVNEQIVHRAIADGAVPYGEERPLDKKLN